MRTLIRRVISAEVKVADQLVGQIKSGLVVYIAVDAHDKETDLNWTIKKILGMRIFEDEESKMNCSVIQKGFDILLISQFTLFGSLKKGYRPSFNQAAPSDFAKDKYEQFFEMIKKNFSGNLATGVFGKDMKISSIDDGPVSLWLDSTNKSY